MSNVVTEVLDIWEVLDIFCEKSGQNVSQSKSRVFFSPNVVMESMEDMCSLLGFRMKQKLLGWKANILSMADRTVLIQSSLSTIPNYTMQCAYLPSKVLDGMGIKGWTYHMCEQEFPSCRGRAGCKSFNRCPQ